eukprot:gene23397-48402_t
MTGAWCPHSAAAPPPCVVLGELLGVGPHRRAGEVCPPSAAARVLR